MIVAAYKSGNALWATVIPVTAIVRYNRYTRQQQGEAKQPDKKTVFASVLRSAESELEAAQGQELNVCV